MPLSAILAILLACPGCPSQESGRDAAPPEPEQRLRIPFFRHAAPVRGAVLPHGGRILVTLDGAGTITGWEWRTGRLLFRRTALAPGEVPQRLTGSPDGRVVVLSPRSPPASLIRILSAESGEEIRRFDRCFSPVLSTDGSIVVGSDGPNIRRWSLKSGAELPGLEETRVDKRWVAISPDGTKVAATLAETGEVVVWSTGSRKVLELRPALLQGVEATALAWTPDGNVLLVGNLWGTHDGSFFETAILGGPPLFATPDGRSIVAGGRGKALGIWDRDTRRLLFEERLPRASPEELGIADDGDIELRIRGRGVHVDPLPHRDAVPVSALAVTPEGRAVVGQGDGTVVFWELETNTEKERREFPSWRAWSFSRDGKRALLFGGEAGFRVAELPSGRELLSPGKTSERSCAALSPDGAWLAVGTLQGGLAIWSVLEKAERARLREEVGIASLSWSDDGKTLLWADWEGGIGVTDVGGRDVVRRRSRGAGVSATALSPDGRVILTGSRSGEVRRWSEDLGKEPSVLRRLDGPVSGLACSPDGRWLASVGGGTIFLDCLDGAQPSLEWSGHRSAVTAVAFSPDGALLLSGGGEAAVLVWRVPRKK